ncbi:hypothetical protein BZG36_00465 [Bifiguratus adelaidae]|uniref:Long-chain-fatty-acid--CoA ligase n=1 Tax=Bifiguratus adelaidae TaxID=1938954 RepID=A0A261Y7G8_9FUNG|nr:hypothetical protein BZG36_00465 [Bifiguratus adelaidae]
MPGEKTPPQHKQTIEVPNTRQPGSTGIYRNAAFPDKLVSKSHSKVNTLYDNWKWGLKISKDRKCIGHRTVDPKTRTLGPYVWQTYREVDRRINNFGSGLLNLAEKHGIQKTEQFPVGIWAINRPEWLISDYAASHYNLFTVALYDTLGPDTVEYVINHAEIELLVVSADHIPALLTLGPKIPNLKVIVSMDKLEGDDQVAPGLPSRFSVLSAWAAEKGIYLTDMATVEAFGSKNRKPNNPPKPDDLACIMYTSGTTGVPKGAMITHRNFVAASAGVSYSVHTSQDDIFISYLPLAHIFGRTAEVSCIKSGCCIGYFSGDVMMLVDDMQVLKPTFMISVPRLLNRIYARLVAATIEAPGVKGALARKAVADKLFNLHHGKGNLHPVWDRIIFSKVKQALGGHVNKILSGSAPLATDVLDFLRIAFCCTVYEGYGATETCAASTVTVPEEYIAGNIGAPFPHNELKLMDVPEMNYLSTDPYPRGEICIRGDNIFRGYFKDEKNTKEAIDADGWCHTGDIGVIDERGSLTIIDRKKNIFKLAQGEYVAPEKIENAYSKNTLIVQLYVHGDSLQSQLVGIVVPDPEALQVLATKLHITSPSKKATLKELCANPKLKAAILKEMDKNARDAGLKGFEYVKAITLTMDAFTIENELLTPTFKVKRPQAAAHFKPEIDAMYAELANAPADNKAFGGENTSKL